MSDDREPGPEATSSPVRMASSGIDLAVVVGGFAAVGWWLDRKYGWAPWGLLTGALLGIVGGMTNFLRDAFRAAREEGEEGRRVARHRSGDDERES